MQPVSSSGQSAPGTPPAIAPRGLLGALGFRVSSAVARLDLPPSWLGELPRQVKLVTFAVCETPRAQAAAGRSIQLMTSTLLPVVSMAPRPPAVSTPEAAPADPAASRSAGSPSPAALEAPAIAPAGASAAGPSTSAAPSAASTAADDFIRSFRALYPGMPAHPALVPESLRMGRLPYLDLRGIARSPTGLISETQTVWDASQLLWSAARAPVPPEGDLASISYFDVNVAAEAIDAIMRDDFEPGPTFRQWETDKLAVRTFLTEMDKSPTFRKLVRLAVELKRLPLTAPGRWGVSGTSPLPGSGPDAALYGQMGPDLGTRRIVVPLRDSRPLGNEYYLFKGGVLLPMNAASQTARYFVSALTGAMLPYSGSWLGADQRVDPMRVGVLGAGERGAVDYLVQRIFKELELDYCWISPLPFTRSQPLMLPDGSWAAVPDAAMESAFDALGGIAAVQGYVEWQDQYLGLLFPLG
ncbi:hypothetical protein BOSP111201_13075 [Bordetella sputigena]|uniref:hypothetical protein n=1 Tax=Bordetella sputigena TaxID=1416810 RepID=UPI0039EE3227